MTARSSETARGGIWACLTQSSVAPPHQQRRTTAAQAHSIQKKSPASTATTCFIPHAQNAFSSRITFTIPTRLLQLGAGLSNKAFSSPQQAICNRPASPRNQPAVPRFYALTIERKNHQLRRPIPQELFSCLSAPLSQCASLSCQPSARTRGHSGLPSPNACTRTWYRAGVLGLRLARGMKHRVQLPPRPQPCIRSSTELR
jgi:hypothetical protein